MLVSKLRSGTSKRKASALFWKFHCATCSLACVIFVPCDRIVQRANRKFFLLPWSCFRCSVVHTLHSVLFISQSPRDLVPVVHVSIQDSALHHLEKLQVDHHCYTHHPYYCGRCCRLLVFNAGENLHHFVQLTNLCDDLVNIWWSRNVLPRRSRKNCLQNLNCFVYEIALLKCYYSISAVKNVHANFHAYRLVFLNMPVLWDL